MIVEVISETDYIASLTLFKVWISETTEYSEYTLETLQKSDQVNIKRLIFL